MGTLAVPASPLSLPGFFKTFFYTPNLGDFLEPDAP